tara:strand:+ start:367 stop:651 length:285 start_codon:yes stop_codon:yes gene_type:complete
LGYTVNEVKARVSYIEYYDWLLFFKKNPPMREHLNNVGAIISNTVFNSAQGQRKRLKLEDFKVTYKDADKTEEEILKDNLRAYEAKHADNFKVI